MNRLLTYVFLTLGGFTLFGASCGPTLRDAALTGASDFVTDTTNQALVSLLTGAGLFPSD